MIYLLIYIVILLQLTKLKIFYINVLFKKRKFGEVKGGGEGGSLLSKPKVILVTLKCLIYLKFTNTWINIFMTDKIVLLFNRQYSLSINWGKIFLFAAYLTYGFYAVISKYNNAFLHYLVYLFHIFLLFKKS